MANRTRYGCNMCKSRYKKPLSSYDTQTSLCLLCTSLAKPILANVAHYDIIVSSLSQVSIFQKVTNFARDNHYPPSLNEIDNNAKSVGISYAEFLGIYIKHNGKLPYPIRKYKFFPKKTFNYRSLETHMTSIRQEDTEPKDHVFTSDEIDFLDSHFGKK